MVNAKKRVKKLGNQSIFKFIQVWKRFYNELRSNKRKSAVFLLFQKQLEEEKISLRINEIRCRIYHLTAKYKAESRAIELSNKQNKSQWKFYNILHEFLKESPISEDHLMQKEALMSPVSPMSEILLPSMLITPNFKENKYYDEFLHSIQKESEEMTKLMKKSMDADAKINEILQESNLVLRKMLACIENQ